jgi:hypothetical protein
MNPKLYDPAQIIMTFLGVPIVGYADGTFVAVARADDAFTMQVGASGEVTRSRSQNKAGSITFTLMQASASNDVLSEAAAQDEVSGLGTGPVFIRDNLGRTVLNAPYGWVRKMPDTEFAKTAGSRVWVLDCSLITMHVGGN